jgi:hypothetical protein
VENERDLRAEFLQKIHITGDTGKRLFFWWGLDDGGRGVILSGEQGEGELLRLKTGRVPMKMEGKTEGATDKIGGVGGKKA